MTTVAVSEQITKTLMETLSDSERAEALEMADRLRDVSGGVLEMGDAEAVYSAVQEFVGRANDAEGTAAANAVLEALYRAKDEIGPKHDVVEAHRVSLEIAIVEVATSTDRLLMAHEENSR